jgi:hypothetical protein
MTNRLRHVQILTRSLSPVEAVLSVSAQAEQMTPPCELRGRATGPTCPYASTIEVAYPLRPSTNDEQPAGRIVIPEPSLWEPLCPFLYYGLIELWQDGEFRDRATIRHGLRSFRIQPHGLFWNGKPLKLKATSRQNLAPNDLPALRSSGFNAILLDWPAPALVEAAERVGFVVLGRMLSPTHDTSSAMNSAALLGWVLPTNWRSQESNWTQWLEPQRRIIGAPYDGGQLPDGIRFLIGGPDRPTGLPRILEGADGELGRLE